ncbi:hypothetical protein B0J14DRAFT_705756 [Halenospora varia]|nr:hypothetical protein B0J14DRAFT_705756 [Halenospora varia]
MFYSKHIVVFTLIFQFLQSVSAGESKPSICKASPGSQDWPSLSQWASLNASVSGRLLKPSSPGAVCHPDQPAYNTTECSTLLNGWYTVLLHTENPISSAWNNWNNDSCLPTLPSPCGGEGYPVYVINATSKEDVKAGVDFAREHNIRLNVKSTGHDYLGRSTSPNSLSIWTHHLKGISISKSFKPQGCNFSIEVPAITAGGGNQMGEVNLAASQAGLYVLSGGSKTVSYGGYLTGGGHSALSSTYGMASDSVLEFEIVSPTGEFLILNECQNQDLFWATRGGGGSTFGVITSVTVQAWPEFNFLTTEVSFGTLAGDPSFYPATNYFLSQFPVLSSLGLTSYNFVTGNSSINGTNYSNFKGTFMLPVLSSQNTTSSLTAALTPLLANISTTHPNQTFTTISSVTTWSTFYDWWLTRNSSDYAGVELVVGSRLIGADALRDTAALETALKGVAPSNVSGKGVNFYLLGGNGLTDTVPRGGSDAVNPAWRSSLVHAVTGATWTPLDNVEKEQAVSYFRNTTMQYLRDLDPDSGAYVNEADPNEPNWQQTFWGSNYDRLLEIKRKVDPGDVFWCKPCVGSETWKVIGNRVCRL